MNYKKSPALIKHLSLAMMTVILDTVIVMLGIQYSPWILIAAAIPTLFLIVTVAKTMTTEYIIQDESIKIKTGVFNQTIQDCRLFRIIDTTIKKPAYLRPFGLGNIIFQTNDKTNPVFKIEAITDVETLADEINSVVAVQRRNNGVTIIER